MAILAFVLGASLIAHCPAGAGLGKNTGTVSHDAALSPGDDEIKQSNLMAGENLLWAKVTKKTGTGNLFICLIISMTIVREFFFCDEKSQFTIRAYPVKKPGTVRANVAML